MRFLLLLTLFFTSIQAEYENESESTQQEFVPIGKDSLTTPSSLDSAKAREDSIVSHKVFKEDGIKYTEIVRQTSSGGTQTGHLKGVVKPSLLPVPVPNFSGLIRRIEERLMARTEVSPVLNAGNHPATAESSQITRGAIYERPAEFYHHTNQYPPPPYPPMMMYPPEPYSLMERVESMTGNIFDNVMEFVIGRQRK